MPKPKLTVAKVRSFKARDRAYTVADGEGLSAHISPSGVVSWRYRYRYLGKATTFVIGKYPEMSLKEAREEHRRAKALLRKGINPTAERRRLKLLALNKNEGQGSRKKNCFRVVAEDWMEQKTAWSPEHAKAVLRTLKNDAFPVLGDLPIDAIQPPQVLEVVRRIEKRGSYEIASKVLQRINAVCRYAVQTGRALHNPASEMKGVLKKRIVEHRPALTIHELPEFLKRLNLSNEHIITKAALKFTLHTAVRSGEVRGATWPEFNFRTKEWRIPAKRMKMRTPHVVPLAEQVIEILRSMMAHSTGKKGYVFPGIKNPYRPLSENTMLYALYRLGYHSRATVHGFRAVFSTITNESGLFDKDAIERQLAHRERNRVRAAYHRSEYLAHRAEMMQWWADLLERLEYGEEDE
ncbi:tyrosine-type recombinase/integrase [Desulfomarina sp.]